MKKIVLLILMMLPVAVYGQNETYSPTEMKEGFASLESLPEGLRDIIFLESENVVIDYIDSLVNEGLYLKALERMDTIETRWKFASGRDLTPLYYIVKCNVLQYLEEWEKIVEIVDYCLLTSHSEGSLSDLALLHNHKGNALKGLFRYSDAIKSYEKATSFYGRNNDLGGQSNMICSMAYCYTKIGKTIMAKELYGKGFKMYLDYFGTSRSALLRTKYMVDGSLKKAALSVFSWHLYNMAIYEQDYGSSQAKKECLLMSANCGNSDAESEYHRIYGYK